MTVKKTLWLGVVALAFGQPAFARANTEIAPPVPLDYIRTTPEVQLSVNASVKSAPDKASFSTGVETIAVSAKMAIEKNAEKMRAVVAQMKAMGIAEKDIQTSALSLSRETTYDAKTRQRRFKGYRVSNTVTGSLVDFSKLGALLDALVTNGATEFSGPEFSLSDPEPAKNQARDKAWATAMKQAEYQARKGGYSRVKVVRVTEDIQVSTMGYPNSALMAGYAADAAAGAAESDGYTEVQGGEISTDVNLNITFEMIP
jgi:uncharacterized protein